MTTSYDSRKTECDLTLTLEEESALLLYGGRRHGEPHHRVGPHGLRPQFGLHLRVERRHGCLDSYGEREKQKKKSKKQLFLFLVGVTKS